MATLRNKKMLAAIDQRNHMKILRATSYGTHFSASLIENIRKHWSVVRRMILILKLVPLPPGRFKIVT